MANEVLAAAQAHLAKEKAWVREIRSGAPIPALFKMKTPDTILPALK
jgi:hypothetical protein